jgi:hypothetical protein
MYFKLLLGLYLYLILKQGPLLPTIFSISRFPAAACLPSARFSLFAPAATAAARSPSTPLYSSTLKSRSSPTNSMCSRQRRVQGHWARLSVRWWERVQIRCIEFLGFEVMLVLDLRVASMSTKCTIEMLSCRVHTRNHRPLIWSRRVKPLWLTLFLSSCVCSLRVQIHLSCRKNSSQGKFRPYLPIGSS